MGHVRRMTVMGAAVALVVFGLLCLVAWDMPVVWRYEQPSAPHAGHVWVYWPLRILVQIAPAARHDAGLHAHEQIHVEQAQRLRPLQFVHPWLYALSRIYRQESELEAALAQLERCGTDDSCIYHVIERLGQVH